MAKLLCLKRTSNPRCIFVKPNRKFDVVLQKLAVMKATYLLLNIFTILPPLFFSFDKKLRFRDRWSFAVPGILVFAILFVGWDYYFTLWGVWRFNPAYVLDMRFGGLPIEEIFFFLTTPFACLFIYEAVSVYYQPRWVVPLAKPWQLLLAAVLLFCAFIYQDRLYTSINFGLAAIVLLSTSIFLPAGILGQFWIAYAVHLVPFYIVNGVLTSWPVLIYNDNQNLGIRIGTIPLEDHAYSLILFLSNFWAYEWFKMKTPLNVVQP